MDNSLVLRCRRFHIYIPGNKTIKVVSLKRFYFYFAAFNILLAIAPLVAEAYYSSNNLLIPHFWWLFLIFSVLTLTIYLIVSLRMQISSKASGQALLGSITLKLLACMVIVLIYLMHTSVNPVRFLVNFFYLYFFHTVFEIYCFLCNLRNQNLK